MWQHFLTCWTSLSKRHEKVISLRNMGKITFQHYRVSTGWPRLLSRYTDSLRAGRSGERNSVGLRFSTPVQTGPGAHPASYTKGTGSFSGVKRPQRGADHPPPPSAEVKERVELYLYPSLGLRGLF